jgi:hypothetical protein
MSRVAAVALGMLGAAALGGCGNLQGLGGPAPPLVTFQIEATGDLGALRPPGITSEVSLQVALVWGAQWWAEPFCVPPPQSDAAKPVVAAGCRDPFGFVPAQVGASVPVSMNQPTTLSLNALPTADLLVGGVSSRVGYASLVLYDDRDGTGTLELSSPHPAPGGGRGGPPETESVDSNDVVYGASFITMTAPDLRVAYLDGTYQLSGFYPRNGCGDPPAGFSILGAGGFTVADALAASAAGTVPMEQDLGACSVAQPDATVVPIAAQSPANVVEVSCAERTLDGSTRYRQPPPDLPDLNVRAFVCVPVPAPAGQPPSDLTQVVVSGLPGDRCKGLTHYTLRGCNEDVSCAIPDWDFTANPPSWWPCLP